MQKNNPKVIVQLVTWNGASYISYLFDSLRKQNFQDWKLVILDNGSTDDTVDAIKKELHSFPVRYELIENEINLGFAGGHNRLFANSDSEYILLLNQDMYLAKNCLSKLVTFMEHHSFVAAVSPRLMKWNFADIEHKGLHKSFSSQIDALGLRVFRSRRVVEQYTKQEWSDIIQLFSKSELEVFGVSGALPLYRRDALLNIAIGSGFFDESYHSYKEDVDVAYRLQQSGYAAYVLLDTMAYHDRSGAGPMDINDRAAAKNKKEQSSWVKYHSYKNHLMTLYKNEYWQNILLDLPFIVWYEFKKLLYYTIFDRSVLKGLKEIHKNRSKLKYKRIAIKNKRKINWKKLRIWWTRK